MVPRGGHNLSVFGEMSMKWKKFWKKFGSKYARLLFLKAPAGNNLQGAFSENVGVSIWCVPFCGIQARRPIKGKRGHRCHEMTICMEKDVVPH